MVNKDLVDWLVEAKKRGYTVQLLKKKLLEGGFPEKDIDEAVTQIEGRPSPKEYPLPAAGKVDLFAPFSAEPMKSNEMKAKDSGGTMQIDKKEDSMKPDAKFGMVSNVEKKDDSKMIAGSGSGAKWMRIAGIMGLLLILITLCGGIIGLLMPDYFTGMLQSTIVLGILLLVVVVVTIFYYIGFVKMGKRTNEKLLSMGSWFTIVPILLYVILAIVAGIVVQQQFTAFASGGSGDSFRVSFLIIAILWVIIFLINAMGFLLFSLGLMKAGKQIKFGKIAGIINIVGFVAFLASIVAIVLLVYNLLNVLSSGNLTSLFESVNSSSMFAIYTLGAFYVVRIIAFVFEDLTLFKASKMFEN